MRGRRAAVARVLADRDLRRIGLAFSGCVAADDGVWTAILVFAYGRGGTSAAGIVAAAQLVPAGLLAPATARLADRRGGGAALTLGYALQAAAFGVAAALVLSGAPALAAYAAAVLAAVAVTFTRPAQAQLVASLVQEPDQLTAAVVVSGWTESVSVLAGPAVAGVLIAIDGPGAALAVFAGVLAVSTLLVWPLAARRPPARDRPPRRAGAPGPPAPAGATTAPDPSGEHRSHSLATIQTLEDPPFPRALIAVIAGPYIAVGAVYVIAVVLAISVLALGPSGAGYLTAAFGAGGVIGAAAAVALIGAMRLTRPMLAAALACAAAFGLLGALSSTAGAIVLLVIAGMSFTLLDVAGRTLLARVTSIEVFARAFGTLESFSTIALAVGSLLVSALAALGGLRLALAAIAIGLAAAALVPARRLLALDCRPTREQIALLRGLSLFSALAPPTLEALACALRPIEVRAGETVMHQGDPGNHFYVIAGGDFEVTVDGTVEAIRHRGEGVGEIALLRDVPRTATIRALDEGRLYALAREPFLTALEAAAAPTADAP